MPAPANARVTIEVRGVNAIVRALRALGERDAPFLRDALDESGRQLHRAVAARAPGGIAASIQYQGVTGSGGRLRARLKATHAGAKAMEFGRKHYYRGYTGRAMKATGQQFTASPGQRADPFVGIRGGEAVGETAPATRRRIVAAIAAEWDRLAGGPD